MNHRKIVIIAVMFVATGLFFWFDLQHYLTLDALKANRQALSEYHAAHRLAAAVIFITLYVIQTALSLPGAAILSLAAGAIFGVFAGTLYAVIAATVGATAAFIATRYLLRDIVLEKFGQKLQGMNRELEVRGFSYLLFLRFVPIFPFFLINLAAGLTSLPLRTFFLATAVGIIPGGFVYVNAGASLASVNSISDVASPRILGSFGLLALFAIIPALYARLKNHHNKDA